MERRCHGGGHRAGQYLLDPMPPLWVHASLAFWPSAAFQFGCLPPGLRASTCRSFRSGFEDAEPSLALRQPRREGPMLWLPFCLSRLRLAFLSTAFVCSLWVPAPPRPWPLPVSACPSPLSRTLLLSIPVSVLLPLHISASIPQWALAPILFFFHFSVCISCLQTFHSIIRLEGQVSFSVTWQQRCMTNTCW